ncbi:MAG: GGDEF domain-containing protein [Eubacteriales bacterium]|nr:GGDEF domain-containing protein [Eubacteriales bacterium]
MKKRIARGLLILFTFGMIFTIILNVFFKIINIKSEFKQNAVENFWQIENIIKNNDDKLNVIKDEFEDKCIVMARTAAYMVENHPEIMEDIEESKYVASLLQVDELHFFNKDGQIFAGTNPEYYGYSFSMGGQIGYFLPMLENYSMELCQDITANTAVGKLMQYVAVWSGNHDVIVQVGLEPDRVLEAVEGNSISDIFSMLSADTASVFYALDIEDNQILGSTNAKHAGHNAGDIGLVLENVSENPSFGTVRIEGKDYYYAACISENLKIVKVCSKNQLLKNIPENILFICLCFMFLFSILFIGIFRFLDKRIIKSILNVNDNLKRIEQGKWDTVLCEKSLPEFEQLSIYINSMVESLLDFPQIMSKALEMSQMPIAICEYVQANNRFTTTNRVRSILSLNDEEYNEIMDNPQSFDTKLQELLVREPDYEDNIFFLNRGEKRFIKVETFYFKLSKITILIDVTKDIAEKQHIEIERDTDMLTGLYNRRAFYRLSDKAFGEFKYDTRGALVVIDLDNLKRVNDDYGHLAGDKYLLAMADMLHLFEAPDRIVSRMGGDEFIIFIYNISGNSEIEDLMDTIRSQRGHIMVDVGQDKQVKLEFSAGYALYPEDANNCLQLITVADERMYHEKLQRKRNMNR